MATIKNDRDKNLQLRGSDSRVMNPKVTIGITSNAPSNIPYFTFAENSTTVSPASITLTATATTAGSYNAPVYAWYYSTELDPTTWVSLNMAAASLTISNSSFVAALAGNTSVNYKVVVSQVGWSTTSVITALNGYRTATTQPYVTLTRDSMILQSTDGVVNYTNSGTDITATINNVPLQYDTSGTIPNSFTVTASPTNISMGTATTNTTAIVNDTRRYPAVSSIIGSSASVVYTITVRDINGKVFTFTKTQSFVVSFAGLSAKTLTLSSDSFVFARDSSNTIISPSYIRLVANKQNTTNTVSWVISPSIPLYSAPTGGTSTTTGDIVYLRSADYGINTYVSITAAIAADGISDSTSISSVKNGSNALLAVLSNVTAPLATTSAGVITYTGSGTTIQVYEGSTLRPINTVTPTNTNITNGAITGLGTTTITVADATTILANNASIKFTLGITKLDGTADTVVVTQSLFKNIAGSTGNAVYAATVYKQSATDPGSPGAGASTYNFSTNTLTPPAGWSVTQPSTTTTPTWACDYTFAGAPNSTITGVGVWSTTYIEAVNGTNGASGVDGEYRDIIELYLTASTPPTAPTSASYTFSTNTVSAITGGNAGWSAVMPTATNTPTYITRGLAKTSAPATPYSITTWSAPVVVAQTGSNGNAVYTATVYKQVAADPGVPTAVSSSYNFSTNILTPPTGWLVVQPSTSTVPTWACDYTFSGLPGTTVVGAGTWGPTYIEAVNGLDGEYRDIIELYLAASSAPTPPTSASFTFSTSTISAVTGGTAGWSLSMPVTTATPTYVTRGLARTNTPSTPYAITTWSSPIITAQAGGAGSQGNAGVDGNKTITVSAFKWSNSGIGAIGNVVFTYTWATGVISAVPSGWTTAANAAPGSGYTLYQLSLIITATALAATTNADWVNAIQNQIGYRQDGSIGPTGTAGPTGGSARTAYVVTASSTTPGSVTPGSGDSPPVDTVANQVSAWSYTSTSNLVAGQYMYKVDGIYNNGAGVVWGNPYLAHLKVGSLSAISADLGVVQVSTTGALYSAGKTSFSSPISGFFMGFDSSTYKWAVGSSTSSGASWDGNTFKITDVNGNTVLSSGVGLETQLNNVSGSGNMVYNSDMSAGVSNWHIGGVQGGGTNYSQPTLDLSGPDWQPAGGHCLGVNRSGTTLAATGYLDLWLDKTIPVTPSTRYESSAYLASHRSECWLLIVYYKLVANVQTYISEQDLGHSARGGGGQNLNNWTRVGGFFTTPADCTFCTIIIRSSATDSSDPYTWATRIYFGKAGPNQAIISDWSSGAGAGGALGNADQINTGNSGSLVGPNAISNTQIGGNLSSTNWNGGVSAGNQGWLLDRTGNFYCNSVFMRGSMQSDNWDGNQGWFMDRVGNLTAQSASLRGSIKGGAFSSYYWPDSGVGGFYLGSEGLLLGNWRVGKYFQVSSEGNIYAPGMKIENGTLTIDQANVINTLNIGGGAVTETFIALGSDNCAWTVNIPAGQTWQITTIASIYTVSWTTTTIYGGSDILGSASGPPSVATSFNVNGGAVGFSAVGGSISIFGTKAYAGPLSLNVRMQGVFTDAQSGKVGQAVGSSAKLMILATKR